MLYEFNLVIFYVDIRQKIGYTDGNIKKQVYVQFYFMIFNFLRKESTDMFKAMFITTTAYVEAEHMYKWHGFGQLRLSENSSCNIN